MFRALKRWWTGKPDVCRCRQCKLQRAAELLAAEHAQRAQREIRQEVGEAEQRARQPRRIGVAVGVCPGEVAVMFLAGGDVHAHVPLTPSEAYTLGEGLMDAAKQARDEAGTAP